MTDIDQKIVARGVYRDIINEFHRVINDHAEDVSSLELVALVSHLLGEAVAFLDDPKMDQPDIDLNKVIKENFSEGYKEASEFLREINTSKNN